MTQSETAQKSKTVEPQDDFQKRLAESYEPHKLGSAKTPFNLDSIVVAPVIRCVGRLREKRRTSKPDGIPPRKYMDVVATKREPPFFDLEDSNRPRRISEYYVSDDTMRVTEFENLYTSEVCEREYIIIPCERRNDILATVSFVIYGKIDSESFLNGRYFELKRIHPTDENPLGPLLTDIPSDGTKMEYRIDEDGGFKKRTVSERLTALLPPKIASRLYSFAAGMSAFLWLGFTVTAIITFSLQSLGIWALGTLTYIWMGLNQPDRHYKNLHYPFGKNPFVETEIKSKEFEPLGLPISDASARYNNSAKFVGIREAVRQRVRELPREVTVTLNDNQDRLQNEQFNVKWSIESSKNEVLLPESVVDFFVEHGFERVEKSKNLEIQTHMVRADHISKYTDGNDPYLLSDCGKWCLLPTPVEYDGQISLDNI